MALCFPVGFFAFQGFGFLFASSGEAGILNAMGPIFTAIIAAVFIRERYNLIQSCSILLSVAGVIYIAVQQGASLDNVAGIALLLLSALAGAIYAVSNRVLIRSFSSFEIAYFLMLVGAVAFSLASFAQHAVCGTFSTVFVPFSDRTFMVAILYLSLFSSLLTTVFVSLALKRLTSAGLTIFLNLSTVISILVGYFWLGEPVHAYHLIGTAMILAGVVGANALEKKI
jgi:drug/metabolite transporter (DMT)-like permease